jgi:hypothetical protein
MALKSLQCGKNQALDKITDGQNAFKKKLNGGLDALDSLAAEADKQLGFLEDELKSQIPTPESLQEKLADLGSASPLEIEAKVKDIKEKFGDVVDDIDSFISASIVDPVAKAAAGLAHNIDAALGFLEGDSFDICKNVPNLELDADGNVIEKAAVAKIANGKNTEAKAVEKTVKDKNKDSSTSGSGVSREEFVEANKQTVVSMRSIINEGPDSYNELYALPAQKEYTTYKKENRKVLRIVRKAGFASNVTAYMQTVKDPDQVVVKYYEQEKLLEKKKKFHNRVLVDLTHLGVTLESKALRNNLKPEDTDEKSNTKLFRYADLYKMYDEKGDDGKVVLEFIEKLKDHFEKYKAAYVVLGKYKQLEQE